MLSNCVFVVILFDLALFSDLKDRIYTIFQNKMLCIMSLIRMADRGISPLTGCQMRLRR